jgi:choline-glycine betaine transporter
MVFVVRMFFAVIVIPPMLHTHSLIQSYVADYVRYVYCSHVVMYVVISLFFLCSHVMSKNLKGGERERERERERYS